MADFRVGIAITERFNALLPFLLYMLYMDGEVCA